MLLIAAINSSVKIVAENIATSVVTHQVQLTDCPGGRHLKEFIFTAGGAVKI